MKYPFFAEKLANGQGIGERLVDLSPFYLYFMVFLKKFLGLEWTSVKVIQSFVGALNCLLLHSLGSRIFRKEVAFLGAMIFALYGNLIILESTLEPLVFILSFNLLCIYFLLRAQDDPRAPGSVAGFVVCAGLFAGLSIITKPNSLLLLPLGAGWLFFFAERNGAILRRVKLTLIFCALALGVVLPVTVRNIVKLGEFVLVTADGGKVFFHGNGKGATALEGTGLPDEGFAEEGVAEPDYAHVLYRKLAAKLSGKAVSPRESSRFWFKRAVKDIEEDRLAYLKLEMKKLLYFFNDYEMHYIASAYKEYETSLSFPFIRYGMIASFGLLGMILALPGFRRLFPVYGMVALYVLSGLLFLVQSRYRTPAVPYLCLFAAYAVWTLKEQISGKRFRALGMTLMAAGALWALTHYVFTDEIQRVDQWQRATKLYYQAGAERLFQMGQYEKAIVELNQCLTLVPDFSPAYNLRGKSRAILGRQTEALADFKKVISLSPGLAEGYKNAGFLYLLQNDPQEAKGYLEKAQALAPQDPKVNEALGKLE
jgi:tetratricopeptide (TPR) repeat protein